MVEANLETGLRVASDVSTAVQGRDSSNPTHHLVSFYLLRLPPLSPVNHIF